MIAKMTPQAQWMTLKCFAWELSMGNFRMASFVSALSLEMFPWELPLGDFRLGTFT